MMRNGCFGVFLAAALLFTNGGLAQRPASLLIEEPEHWADEMAQALDQKQFDRADALMLAKIPPDAGEKIASILARIKDDIDKLGKPELLDKIRSETLGTSIAIYGYYLAYSHGEYFLRLSFHRHLGGWALSNISYGGDAAQILNGY